MLSQVNAPDVKVPTEVTAPYARVLGVAQDGGYPQAGCQSPCCLPAWKNVERRRAVAALGIVDPASGEGWLIDCTPDFPQQLARLCGDAAEQKLSGIILTHAHMGHYSGLIYLGKEAMAADAMPVYAMPRMQDFLQQHQPWAALCEQEHLQLRALADQETQQLNDRIQVTTLVVPHRAEFSETIGVIVEGPSGRLLWLPDIDGWEDCQPTIESLLEQVDVAYLDGTFFTEEELTGRVLTEVPHPTVTESMQRFSALSEENRAKVRFVHFNHSNALLDPASSATKLVTGAGYTVAQQGEWLPLG